MRPSDRKNYEMRTISFETGVSKHAEGSCLVKFGDTHVLCTASVENRVPPWLRNSGSGWVTAEYGMLPRSTGDRMRREASVGKQSGRTQEIQRLIGRSLRSVVDLEKLTGYQIIIDCDVLNADGGTRTASITGGYVALCLAIKKLISRGLIKKNPIKDFVAAISCGILNEKILVDLDYDEDSAAQVDANFVLSKKSGFSEIQISGEENTFNLNSVTEMITKTEKSMKNIFKIQKDAIK